LDGRNFTCIMVVGSHFFRVLCLVNPPVFHLYSSFPTRVNNTVKKLHNNFYGVNPMKNLSFICWIGIQLGILWNMRGWGLGNPPLSNQVMLGERF